VSGGCVEADLFQRYHNLELGEDKITRINYGVNRDDAHRFGLPCGGRLELLVESLVDPVHWETLLAALKGGELIVREVDLLSGDVALYPAAPAQNFLVTENKVRTVFGKEWCMLLIGAGHLSNYVARLAMMLDYQVIVCDPREEHASNWHVEGTELTTMMPDDAVQHYVNSSRAIVLALTHDPRLDDMALLDALNSPAFYIGAIGSQRNCALRRERLRQLGVDDARLNRLHAPTGLAIGSHTPAEIAVSVLAEITQLRNEHE
jgi:xanthine dehydrogenase accessory factor